jgi:hypothetical protein
MTLSSDLISQFVKVTNNNTKQKAETTTYGTVFIVDGGTYVQFDGSDLLTPVLTTAMVDNKERVMVSIKNHVATIVGNMSSPAAGNSAVQGVVQGAVANTEDRINHSVSVQLGDYKQQIDLLLSEQDQKILKKLADDLAEFNDGIKADFEEIKANYAEIDFANINTANINKAVIKDLFTQIGFIKDAVIQNGHITGYLDAVEVNAASITAGTLSVDRLVINGSEESIIYALNNSGNLTSTSVNTLDGGLLTDHTVNADKIVAHSITAEQITTDNIRGVNGWINLAEGTFNYGNQLVWDGEKLTISIGSIIDSADGHFMTKDDIDNIKVGARNLIRNSKTLDFKDYYFEATPMDVMYIIDELGNELLDEATYKITV